MASPVDLDSSRAENADMDIRLREDHTPGLFLKRTIAAQIHFAGFFLAIIGLAVLLWKVVSGKANTSTDLLAILAFAVPSILVFMASTVYHFMTDGLLVSEKLRKRLKNLDHFSIYLFIAGTYTPVLLKTVHSVWRVPMLIAIWSIALIGICYTAFKPRFPSWARHRIFSTLIFLSMGWLAVARLHEIWSGLSPSGHFYLLAGGISYTVGAVIYAFKWPRLFHGVFGFHELWHITVLLGFGFHFLLVLGLF